MLKIKWEAEVFVQERVSLCRPAMSGNSHHNHHNHASTNTSTTITAI
jgi:hypothetical protein